MSYRARHGIPDLGVGVGFRAAHRADVLDRRQAMDWLEIVSENFLVAGGRAIETIERLREAYRVVPHGVSLAIGSVDSLDGDYLAALRALLARLDPPWFSDHLAWGRAGGVHLHDLLPLPYTQEAVAHVVERVKRVQGELARPFALENVSSYLAFRESTLTEWDFLSEVVEQADCGIVLDCNNVYVSARNRGFDPAAYIDSLPVDRVVQIHLAGHTDRGRYVLDTHAAPVQPEVWALYRRAIQRCGSVATLVEWDDAIPSWDVLAAEAAKARALRGSTLGSAP